MESITGDKPVMFLDDVMSELDENQTGLYSQSFKRPGRFLSPAVDQIPFIN